MVLVRRPTAILHRGGVEKAISRKGAEDAVVVADHGEDLGPFGEDLAHSTKPRDGLR